MTDPMNAATIAVRASESTPMERIWGMTSGRYVLGSRQSAAVALERK